MKNEEIREVFFSWSGSKSKAIALKFKDLFGSVFTPSINSFMSTKDIGAGKRSIDELFSALERCNYGVSFVDTENAKEPWIQFEAGALSKIIDVSQVMVLILDDNMRSLEHTPLNEFQHKLFNKDDIKSIFEEIIKCFKLEDAKEAFMQRFEIGWDAFYNSAHQILEKGEKLKEKENEKDEKDDKLDVVMKMLLNVQNLLKTEWTQNIKEGKGMVNELKNIIRSLKPEDVLNVQLSFKIQRYELFSQQIIHGIEDVIEDMENGGNDDCIERNKIRLEHLIQDAISLIGD